MRMLLKLLVFLTLTPFVAVGMLLGCCVVGVLIGYNVVNLYTVGTRPKASADT